MKHLCSHPMLKSAISLLVCLVFVVQLTACGTIMYPERRGLARNPSQIDVKVVVMDGVLLLFFVLPGLVAYGVDFATGCIYLPPGQIMQNMDELDPASMQVIRVEPESLNLDMLPDIIAQHTGVSVPAHTSEMRIFRPDSVGSLTGDIHIQQELALLVNGRTPKTPGRWYTSDQITLVADASGRITNIGLVVPQEARLAGE